MKTPELIQITKEIPKELVRVEVRSCNLLVNTLRSD
jgi:hypothetical protein